MYLFTALNFNNTEDEKAAYGKRNRLVRVDRYTHVHVVDYTAPARPDTAPEGLLGRREAGVPDLASPVRSRYFLFEGYAADVVPRPSMAARDQRSAWPSMRRKGFSVSSQAEAAQRRTMSPSRQRVTLCVSRSLCPAGIPLILYWCWPGSCAGNRDRPNHLEESASKRPNAALKSYEYCNCWSVSKPRKR